MKKFSRLFFSLLLILIIFNYKTASASWWDDPLDYFSVYPNNDSIMKYDEGSSVDRQGQFYFGQKGTTRYSNTNTYYSIEGFNYYITDPTNGKIYYGSMSVSGNMWVRNTPHTDGKTYSLWMIDIPTLISNLKYHNPDGDFAFIFDSNWPTTVIFNAIVSINYNGVRNGYVGKYGNVTSGSVVTGIGGLPSWMTTEEKRALYNIEGNIPTNNKPYVQSGILNQTNGSINLYGPNDSKPAEFTSAYKTVKYRDSSGNYWVNLKDPFTLYSVNGLRNNTNLGANAYPSYGRIGVDTIKHTNDPTNLAYMYYTNTSGQYYGNAAFNEHFTQVSGNFKRRKTSSHNYNDSFLTMIARKDNMTYYPKTRTFIGSTGAGTWYHLSTTLKTDGTAPTISGGASTSNWTNQNVSISLNASDNGSGMNSVTIYDNDWGWKAGSTNSTNHTVTSEGEQTYRLKAVDNVGNERHTTTTVKIDKTPPTATSAEIKNITDTGYDVYVYGVSDSLSGVKEVKFPTWTTVNGQDDITWHNGTNKGNGTWYYRVNISDHWNQKSTNYQTHIYAYDNAGNNRQVGAFDNIYVPTWKAPITNANGVWLDTGSGPGVSVYTSADGVKWVKPNQTFYISAVGESLSSDQQIDEMHLYLDNLSNSSENQLVKAGLTRGKDWNYSFWQDNVPNNTIKFVDGNYGSVRRGDNWNPNGKGKYVESYFKMKLTTDNKDYRQGTRALILENNNSVFLWSNGSNYDFYNTIKTDGTAPTITFTPDSRAWGNTEVQVTMKPSDSRSGVKQWRYRTSKNDGSTYGSWTEYIQGNPEKSIKFTEEGIWKIQVEMEDNVGNSRTTTSNSYKIDLTAPNGVINPNSATWTNSNVIVSFNPSDTGGSGVKEWKYRQSSDDGNTWGGWTTITGDTTSNITVSKESATNKIQIVVTDIAGNTKTLTSGIYQIDKSKPSGVFTPNSSDWRNSNLTVSFNPSDTGGSGVKEWKYRQSSDDGNTWGGWTTITGDTTSNITVSKESATNKIQVVVTDIAGNTETLTSGVYKIDKTAPTATSYDVVDRQDDTFTIDIVGVTDNNGSGVKSQQVKVWVDTPSGRKEKLYTPMTVDSNRGRVVVNRNDFTGVTKTYYYELTLVDNVGNSRTYAAKTGTMIQNNLTSRRIDIYDPREKRYVSQVISGLKYQAVVEVQNTGERAISKSFDIGLKIDGTERGVIKESSGIIKDQVKEYKFDFTADDENLKGVIFEGVADYNDIIYETNENDNIISSENPYSVPRSDENPPTIPPIPPTGEKIITPVPIITVKLDLVAEYIDIVELNTETVVSEVITDDTYRFKYRIKNNSSLALRYLDILQKTFDNKIYYDGTEIGATTINEMSKGEVKTFYKEYKVPLLPDNIVETIKPIRLDVDINNSIKETDETNNSISKNKKIIGLKVTDYRITDSVNPIYSLNYPIYTSEMPLRVKAGYNVTFMVNVLGKPDRVYSKVKDSRGKDYGIVEMKKVKDIDNVRSEWEYTFAPHVDTQDDTIIITEIYAARNSFIYNYNSKEGWNGNTLKIGGSAKEDIIIYRKY